MITSSEGDQPAQGTAVLGTPTRPGRRRHEVADRRIAVLVIVSSLLGAVTLRRPDLDPELVVVTLATVAAAAGAGVAMFVMPTAFGIRSFRVVGGFILGTHLMILIGLPSTFARFRTEDPTAAWTLVAIVLSSYVLVVVVVGWFERLSPVVTHSSVATTSRYLWLVVSVAVVTVLAFLVVTWPPPVIEALGGTRGAELDRLRQASFARVQPLALAYAFGFARTVALPFVVAALLIRSLQRPTARTILPAVGTGLLAVLAVTATVEKSLVPRFALVIVIALAQVGRRRSKALIAFGAGAAVASMAFLFLIARQANSSATSTLDLVAALIRRVAILPGEVVYDYVRFTDQEGLGLGRSIPYVSKTIPGGFRDLPAEVFEFAFPTSTLSGGHANGSYVGFLWADLGWVGIIFGSMFVAAGLIVLERACRSLGPSPEGKALRAVVFVQATQLASTSVFDSVLVFPFGLVDVVLLAVAVRLLTRRAARKGERVPNRLDPVPVLVNPVGGG